MAQSGHQPRRQRKHQRHHAQASLGYDKSKSKPYRNTLDILARFLHYHDFNAFCDQKGDPFAGGSEGEAFHRLTPGVGIKSNDLRRGERLHVSWSPASTCIFRYDGAMRFTVTESQGTELVKGDTFTCPILISGMPLCLYDLTHQGEANLVFICARQGGIEVNIDPNPAPP